MIAVSSITKKLGGAEILKGLSFELSERGVTGLLGPNGAGKSTTLRILTTLLAPTSGRVTIGGFDTVEQAEDVRKLIGYLPETPPLYTELRVQEFLRIAGQLHSLSGRALEVAVQSAIERCQLTEVSNRIIGHLSKGYRQRVGIAQAILHDPKVVFLDEPTSGLDPMQLVETRALIRKLGEDRAVIFSSHILQEVVETCSRAILIVKGAIRFDDSVLESTQARELEAHFIEGVRGA